MQEIPKTLPEFLGWAAAAGATVLVGLLIIALKKLFPAVKAWMESQSPDVQQALAVVGSILIGVGAALAQFGLGYKEAPETGIAWAELLFGYLLVPLLSGLSLRQVIVVNPRQQRLYQADRQAYRQTLQ